jgi:hypothetical protein
MQAKDIVTLIIETIVHKIEESLPKTCDGPPPDLSKLIPGLHVDGEGGGLSPINHFKADHVRDLPCLAMDGYDAPLPIVLLVLTGALRAQQCMDRSNVFPGVSMAMRQRHFGWIADTVRAARAAMGDGTFMTRKWPLQVLASLLLTWMRAYPNQLMGAVPTRRIMDENVHADNEKLESVSGLNSFRVRLTCVYIRSVVHPVSSTPSVDLLRRVASVRLLLYCHAVILSAFLPAVLTSFICPRCR